MNLKSKVLILAYVILYAVVNYIGYIFKFEFIDNHLVIIKDSSEFKNNFDKILFSFPNIELSDWYSFLFGLNLHIFIFCVLIQYRISLELNGSKGLNVLVFSLVFIFLLKHLSKHFSVSDINLLRWFGLNIFTRSLKVYNFLMYFPSLPFLTLIINKSITDKLKIKSSKDFDI